MRILVLVYRTARMLLFQEKHDVEVGRLFPGWAFEDCLIGSAKCFDCGIHGYDSCDFFLVIPVEDFMAEDYPLEMVGCNCSMNLDTDLWIPKRQIS
ncbi:unnamed protein product [Notodromas monacha]|uniref:Uncharacterized protein n=1 Tax=Notodromas monacha TaxID=399045 RepID=A0A7R9BCU4_9CRUS|nr:unnamed protein product [Notodromas monacha]CAG0912991.1 unnamed protein product [Notodromas monacha]